MHTLSSGRAHDLAGRKEYCLEYLTTLVPEKKKSAWMSARVHPLVLLSWRMSLACSVAARFQRSFFSHPEKSEKKEPPNRPNLFLMSSK